MIDTSRRDLNAKPIMEGTPWLECRSYLSWERKTKKNRKQSLPSLPKTRAFTRVNGSSRRSSLIKDELPEEQMNETQARLYSAAKLARG